MSDLPTQSQFLNAVSSQFQQQGYLIEFDPQIPGTQCALYARSPRPLRLLFSRVEDHFLFIDWENAVFGRLALLLETHRRFSRFVNLGYHIPHSLRMTIPNLAIIAFSLNEFPAEAIRFAHTTYLTPWYGGETGQVLLADLSEKKFFYHPTPRFRERGSLPLIQTAEILQEIIRKSYCIMYNNIKDTMKGFS